MAEPLATVKLTRGTNYFYLPSGKPLCTGGLMEFFDFPHTAERLWLSFYTRPAKNRYEIRFHKPCPGCENNPKGIRDSCPGVWLADGEDVGLERPPELTRLAKKYNRTVFYVECEWE